MTIAYLTSEYPALSHTFVRREIAHLREQGLTIAPFSIRKAKISWGEDVPSVLGQSKAKLLGRALKAAVRNPARVFSTLSLAQRHRVPGLRAWVWSIFHFVEGLALSDMLRAVSAVHLHSHFANSGVTVGMLAAHQAGIPWSLTLHGNSETDYPAGVVLPEKIARARFVSCASWFMQSQGMRIVPPAMWGKFHIVRCGVSVPAVASPPNPPVRRFCTVGRLTAEKAQSGLITAVRNLSAKGEDVSVRVVGDGPMRGELERSVVDAGLSDRITFLGGLPEETTLQEIASADAFVLPSLIEGLPVVLMEAMAAGKPVIAATMAGIPEMITHERTGLLFDVGNWADLEAQIERLMHDDALALRIGAAGRERIEREFDIRKAAQPLVALFGSPSSSRTEVRQS